MTTPIDIALIYGSTRPGRLCGKVADWIGTHLDSHADFQPQRIDPYVPSTAAGTTANTDRPFQQHMAAADAFIIVTPEYNNGYPAPLKALIDDHTSEWQAKPVAFVSYGGISGGIRAVEQLRTVLAALDAAPIRDSVILQNAWHQLDDAGRLRPPEPAEQAADLMLARLHWWAAALRDARQARPYAEALPRR